MTRKHNSKTQALCCVYVGTCSNIVKYKTERQYAYYVLFHFKNSN